MDTIQLQQSVLHDVTSLLGDTEALKKLQKMLQRLIKEKAAREEMTAAEKAEAPDNIREGLRELKLRQQGEPKTRPAEELLREPYTPAELEARLDQAEADDQAGKLEAHSRVMQQAHKYLAAL